jgi:hypothetical protein
MEKLRIVLVFLSCVVFLSPACTATAAGAEAKTLSARVVDLRTEHMVNPIGIGEVNPLLMWQVRGAARVKAYEIRVARAPAELGQGKLLWDSGRVTWKGFGAAYISQVKLTSRERAAWQVRVWDGHNHASPWSTPATFEMGLLSPNDWSARWIENSEYRYTQADGSVIPLPIFAKAFRISGPVSRARLYITGLGMYSARLNGRPFTKDVLEPGQTTYGSEVDYRTYDVTAQLRSGDNTLRIDTGSGAYQRVPTPGRYFFGGFFEEAHPYGTPKVIAQLEITYANGRRETVATDGSWRAALGPTTFSSWWSGEEYDARRELDLGAKGKAGISWTQASIVKLSATTTPTDSTLLRAEPRPPVRIVESAQPISIRAISNGAYILDFGANRSGLPRIHVSAKAGTEITMIPAEKLNANGSIDISSTGARVGKQIAYRYTAAGGGPEDWHAQFTYNGFRYLEVDGLLQTPDKTTVTVDVIHATNPSASEFTSSNPLLQSIRAMALRAIQSNMMSVLTDCPGREKGPYTGDNLQNLDALLTDFDMSAYEPQLVRNMATAQRKPGDVDPGLIANIAPEFHRVNGRMINRPGGAIEFLDEVNWGGAVIRIPWRLYEVYGDTRTMARYYDNMVAWLNYEATNREQHNGDIPGLGDWLADDRSTPMLLPILAGYYTAASDMAKIATVLGKTDDEAKYMSLAEGLAKDFNNRFRHVDNEGVYYGSDSETSDAMALDAGLVAPSERAQVVKRLVGSIRHAGNHITAGSVGLGPLFRALETAGRNDVLYEMVVNPTAPGYGYLARAGYTSLPENLNGGGSQNHHFLAEVDAWLISGLAGIRQAPDSIAYQKVIIAPAVVSELTQVSGAYATPMGQIRSTWRKFGPHGLRMEVELSPGTTAEVHVPLIRGQSVEAVSEGRAPHLERRTTNGPVYGIGPGRSTFSVTE